MKPEEDRTLTNLEYCMVRAGMQTVTSAPPCEEVAPPAPDPPQAAVPPLPQFVRDTLQECARVEGVTLLQMVTPCREHPVVRARIAAARKLRDHGATLHQLGRWFNCSHTTVIYYLQQSLSSTGNEGIPDSNQEPTGAA